MSTCKTCKGTLVTYDAEDGCPMDCPTCGGLPGKLRALGNALAAAVEAKLEATPPDGHPSEVMKTMAVRTALVAWRKGST